MLNLSRRCSWLAASHFHTHPRSLPHVRSIDRTVSVKPQPFDMDLKCNLDLSKSLLQRAVALRRISTTFQDLVDVCKLGLVGLPQGKTKVSSHRSTNTLLLTGPAWTRPLARNTLRCNSSSTALLGLPVAFQTSRAQLLSECGATSTDICLLHSAGACFIGGSRRREEG